MHWMFKEIVLAAESSLDYSAPLQIPDALGNPQYCEYFDTIPINRSITNMYDKIYIYIYMCVCVCVCVCVCELYQLFLI